MTSTHAQPDSNSLRLIAERFAITNDPPSGWTHLRGLPLVILVGLTGVGKSTLLKTLDKPALALIRVPDRRFLTDELLIPQVQTDAGMKVEPVTDRVQRFALTRRYRERYPGGMAHALTQLAVKTVDTHATFIFDGLRGIEEVTHAATLLPTARFVVLHAPDIVRVQRLLFRNDDFDQLTVSASETATSATDLVEALPEAAQIFSIAELLLLERKAQAKDVPRKELLDKLKIVVSERRNYDPDGASEILRGSANSRSLNVDTHQLSPTATAQLVVDWIGV